GAIVGPTDRRVLDAAEDRLAEEVVVRAGVLEVAPCGGRGCGAVRRGATRRGGGLAVLAVLVVDRRDLCHRRVELVLLRGGRGVLVLRRVGGGGWPVQVPGWASPGLQQRAGSPGSCGVAGRTGRSSRGGACVRSARPWPRGGSQPRARGLPPPPAHPVHPAPGRRRRWATKPHPAAGAVTVRGLFCPGSRRRRRRVRRTCSAPQVRGRRRGGPCSIRH